MKKSHLYLLVAAASLGFGGIAHAECSYPKAPDAVPDGGTATEQEMVTAMKALKAYNVEMTAYLSCLDKDAETSIAAAGPKATPDQISQIKTIQTQRHNAAVDELTAHADSFNKQVQAYKAKKAG
jgi:hypothetical protein